jgi:hypothetical protein
LASSAAAAHADRCNGDDPRGRAHFNAATVCGFDRRHGSGAAQ